MAYNNLLFLISTIIFKVADAEVDISLCLDEIAKTYFTPGKTLVISYNSSNNDTFDSWDNVIEVAFKSERWKIIIHNNRYDYNEDNDSDTELHGSYIIESEAQNYQDTLLDIKRQVLQLKMRRTWNPRARFVLLLLNYQLDAKIMCSDIFTLLWKWKVVNIVILVPSYDSINSSISMLNIYSWFPYESFGNCGKNTDASLINIWTEGSDNKQHLMYNNSLFPEKIPKFLHGCPLKISLFEYPPMIMGMNTNEAGTIEYSGGTEVELFRIIAEYLNMSIIYLPPNAIAWGTQLENGTVTGMLGEVISGYSDLALDNFWYRCHVHNEIQCLTSHSIDAARWFVPCTQPYPRWTSLTRVFKLSLWLGFLAAYIIFSLFMCLMTSLSNSFSPPKNQDKSYSNIPLCLLNFWAVILQNSVPHDPPGVHSIRIIFLVWVLYCWAFENVYQTFLTSYLVDPGLQKQLSSEQEMLDSGITFAIPEVIVLVIPYLSTERYVRNVYCPIFKECFDRTAHHNDLAFVFSQLHMQYITAEQYVNGDGKALICHFDEVITNQIISIPVYKGFPLIDKFNLIILNAIEAGLMNQWLKRIVYTATLESARNFNLAPGDYIKLTTDHLQSAFYFLLLGYAISVTTFVGELLCKKLSSIQLLRKY
ncbi:hypothetical protein C0J52_16959 [Blattella germanica]|nr:Ionotropic receptor 205 [Blattella germanica]PSN38753.1 hypothetical protein C0J52_16959 [Blattella germanica]